MLGNYKDLRLVFLMLFSLGFLLGFNDFIEEVRLFLIV